MNDSTNEGRLAAYFSRIGLAGQLTPDAAGLAALKRAHRTAIAFENLDIPLGRPIEVASDPVFVKLVIGKRGGYCFEHNRLFRDMLGVIGFAVRPLLARVHLGLLAGAMPPRTHILLLVTIDGAPWIADAGFGGAYVPPMPLGGGGIVEGPDGAVHRLVRQGAPGVLPGEWRLDRRAAGAEDWQAQYSFELAEVAEADLVQASHWTSTRPGERFTTQRILSIALPTGFASLSERTYKVTDLGSSSEREIRDAADYRAVLAERFGLDLSVAEVAALGLF
jgi:N-hydroxyarylamine O-acetyltransferase